jgi:hypothetical protein
MKTEGQKWVLRRYNQFISNVEEAVGDIDIEDYDNFKDYSDEVHDRAISIYLSQIDDEGSDDIWNIYGSIKSTMEDIFNDQLKDYYYSHSEETLNESFDQILDLYKKRKDGETLRPSEETMMRSFKKFVDKGGNAEEFVYDLDQEMMPDEREGERFRWERYGTPLTYEFSEEYESDGEINYFGEIKYMGDEFLGVISTDKRGYLTDYDFYSVFDEEVRLQDILKENGLEPEITNFFQEEIINSLRK